MAEQDEMPEVVYHYTSVATLKAIVESNTLWATSLDYLNDVSEGQLFLKAAQRRIHHVAALKHLRLDVLADLLLHESRARAIYQLPFVVSFTKHRNSLPQWRSYCHGGNGVSIGFKTAHIKRDMFEPYGYGSTFGLDSPVTSLHPVAYLTDLDDASVDRMLTEDADAAQKFGVSSAPESAISWRVKARAAVVKDHSFIDEGECRMIVNNVNPRLYSSILGVRASATTLVPYIKVPLSENVSPDEPSSPICEVVVGPCPNPALTVEAVRFLMTISGTDAEVSSSMLPYRDL